MSNSADNHAKPASRDPATGRTQTGRWLLEDAKARLGEVMRLARSEGPQRVMVQGRDEVVVISAEEYVRLTGHETGEALIRAMQAIPEPDLVIESPHERSPVRDVIF